MYCSKKKIIIQNIYFNDNFNNVGKIWNGIKDIISVKSSTNYIPSCLNINNTIVTDPLCISNTFNNYFSSIADDIRKTIPTSNKHFSTFLKNPVANSIFLSANPDEILKCISSLDLSKSSGPFSISSNILKRS